MAERTVYIYALCDPDAPEVPRYIGQSSNPYERRIRHMVLEDGDRSARAEWIRALRAANRRPVLKILAEATRATASAMEAEQIRLYAESRLLTNTWLNPYQKPQPQGQYTVCGVHNAHWEKRQWKRAAQVRSAQAAP